MSVPEKFCCKLFKERVALGTITQNKISSKGINYRLLGLRNDVWITFGFCPWCGKKIQV